MYRSTKARKCTKTTTEDSKHPDEPSNCIICLEKVVCRGKLSVCNHWFCFPCILEWSENTNTCPICKTRFRCITKIHLDPFRSPPTKVRVGDCDQRVWNDDDELVADDLLDAIDSDNSNGDQEPSISVENPRTRSTRRQVDRRGNSETSRLLRLDDYDHEDSFIDDTDEALQAYLYATYSQEDLGVINNDGEESSSGESCDDDSVGQRTSPYQFRNRRATLRTSSRNTRSSTFDSLSEIGVDVLCLSPASIGNFIVEDDESSDERYNIAVPFGNHSKKFKGKRKVKTRKHNNSRTRKSSETSRPNASTNRRSQRSHKPRKQQEPQEESSKSKRKRQTSVSDDEFQPGTSSRSRSPTNQRSTDGWISMATKRAEAHSLTPSTTNQRTVTRKRACKGKKPVENGESSSHSEAYESSSDSENEVLSERIKKARVKARSDVKKEKECQNVSKTSVTTRKSENKQTNKFCARQELQQRGIGSPSTSTSTEMQEDDFSIVTFVKPTPQSNKKRSIFTKRQHRSPSTSFDHLEGYAISPTEMQRKKSGLTNHQLKTISNHKRTETSLVHKSDTVIKLETSPLVKKKKPRRARVLVSSDSD